MIVLAVIIVGVALIALAVWQEMEWRKIDAAIDAYRQAVDRYVDCVNRHDREQRQIVIDWMLKGLKRQGGEEQLSTTRGHTPQRG